MQASRCAECIASRPPCRWCASEDSQDDGSDNR
ncbi:hypothetical protein C7C56_005375 [Massilia glaciei]|uniref:Integrin beta N-terminal domain-containing protein n=1 Tax=Massilia glaciei TaxID=1524097 RepID=A0A2U2I4L3_9BURK|nr:hypothetical protein C7C56_005375 [Massilia glaciei]